MNVNLFTSWYYDDEEILKIRKEEFDFCKEKNKISGIDNIIELNIGRMSLSKQMAPLGSL